MTPQQIFDTAYFAIIKQGKPAVNKGSCMYRAPDGTKCAFGHLIPDELYTTAMERNSAAGILIRTEVPEFVPVQNMFKDHMNLISDIQACHDVAWTAGDKFVQSFMFKMAEVAKTYNLVVKEKPDDDVH